ncbi:G-alpha-domain-containing protein [Macrolepiota fuliginosa MF-IS2]|uniref:G-alpha-domain-containing protein n=1 Tax=Macrolepiota fuliginosa MF-IS2 TaxID=1400762 RepID=A0A9P6C0B2_9AGAR|nr:G-alpha-domain-containing protein [Macrolepiota fuliginosa MF-IS2]
MHPKQNHLQLHPRPRTLSDPLAAALLPPPDESEEARRHRIQAENDAKRISESIDEQLQQERLERKKVRPEVNVLLLGQSESGKSTTLKQFRLLYSPATFYSERIAWRAVIYLNLVRSVRRILEALAPESETLDEHEDLDSTEAETDIIISSNGRPPSAILGTRVTKYEDYRRRLASLAQLEDRLTRLLSSPDEDEPTHLGPSHPSWDSVRNFYSNEIMSNGFGGRPTPTITIPHKQPSHMARSVSAGGHDSRGKEVAVRSDSEWKRAFQLRLGYKSKSPKTPKSGEIEGWWEDPDDPVHALHPCTKAMEELWSDPQVRQRLEEKRLRLEESSGFYLDEISRITAKKYIPTDADVLKARLKTTGVVEHTFVINTGHSKGVQWRVHDVGGARNQRQAWAPYFDDVNAIIFLAPISAFDQVLAEDPRINRLEDSLLLWKSLVSNPLLAKVNIVLFLNKCDLLQAKLDAGVRLSHHMYTYGDRPNDYESVSKYFRNKFGALHMSYSRNKERELYIHFTAVTDTRRTQTIISSVRDIIIKSNLRTMRLV